MFAYKLFLANLTMILLFTNDSEWEKSLEKDNIVIYTRLTEDSKFKEFLAVATMEGSIDKFVKIFTDIENYPDWMPDCKSVVVVENPSPNDYTYFMKLKVPFPFTNRDIVQQFILKKDGAKLEVELINRPEKVPVDKKYERMQQARGKWIIKEISDKEISVRFQFFADPGGDIPAWLANSFVVKNPHLTLRNLKERMAN